MLTVNQFFTAGRVVAQSDLLAVLPLSFLAATGIASKLVTHELPFDPGAVQSGWCGICAATPTPRTVGCATC